jgi:hypothetical protein
MMNTRALMELIVIEPLYLQSAFAQWIEGR